MRAGMGERRGEGRGLGQGRCPDTAAVSAPLTSAAPPCARGARSSLHLSVSRPSHQNGHSRSAGKPPHVAAARHAPHITPAAQRAAGDPIGGSPRHGTARTWALSGPNTLSKVKLYAARPSAPRLTPSARRPCLRRTPVGTLSKRDARRRRAAIPSAIPFARTGGHIFRAPFPVCPPRLSRSICRITPIDTRRGFGRTPLAAGRRRHAPALLSRQGATCLGRDQVHHFPDGGAAGAVAGLDLLGLHDGARARLGVPEQLLRSNRGENRGQQHRHPREPSSRPRRDKPSAARNTEISYHRAMGELSCCYRSSEGHRRTGRIRQYTRMLPLSSWIAL